MVVKVKLTATNLRSNMYFPTIQNKQSSQLVPDSMPLHVVDVVAADIEHAGLSSRLHVWSTAAVMLHGSDTSIHQIECADLPVKKEGFPDRLQQVLATGPITGQREHRHSS